MSIRQVWVCDRCEAEGEPKDPNWRPLPLPKGWARVGVYFEEQKFIDLCEPCRDKLKSAWETWMKRPKEIDP
jgi:hypothetical protein